MKRENRTDDPGLEIWDTCAAEVGEMNDDERTRLMEEYFLSEYQKAVSEGRTALFAYRNESIGRQFVVAGSGDVNGQVLWQLTDHKTTPMAEAEVKFYRWFNHTFEEDMRFRTQTDANGCYSVEKLPYGIWAIESQYGDIKAFTTLEHHTARCSAPDIEFRFALTGRVLQPDEYFTLTPCVGASVTLESLDGNGVAHSSQSTDASGDYCFMVPPGRYRITASKG